MSRDAVYADPELAKFYSHNHFWFGPGRLVVIENTPDQYNKEHDRVHVVLAKEKPDNEATEGEWYTAGDLTRARADFADFDGRVDRVLALADPKNCYTWRLQDMPPLSTWVGKNGRMVIVGDAAHAMFPYAGQGAAMGIEDAACLAECLDRAKSADDIPRLLKTFEIIRKPRAEWTVARGRVVAKMFHLPDGEEQRARDERLGKSQFGMHVNGEWDGKHVDEIPENWEHPLIFPYLSGHDVVDYVSALWDCDCYNLLTTCRKQTNRKLDVMLDGALH